ncbi:hypothetical protein ASD65_17530 [Microbacterium sp. Root61]|uniref:TetR/AcrR family transcriptional regulator n=1 Tax=Microbacterium sp. Root61 TaxID=1736570 RepID=UPI0006FEEF80|nr:TetR/AcrR family transcriptional regulator [Microbacterium sp. Root61]KRA22294.1 hypothetical protein ASD65_17530 [Microbacterium sp. Root61]
MVDGVPDTQTAILDAALEEVLSHGIRRTSVSDIARRAGVARQTLYRYWPDAQSVFAALVTRELLAVLPGSERDAATLDELVEVLVSTTSHMRRMALVDRLRDTDPELFAHYILDRLGTSQRAIHAELARRIAHGQQAGYVRAGDPAQLAAVVLLTAQASVQSAPLVAEWIDDDGWSAELEHLLRGYLGCRS